MLFQYILASHAQKLQERTFAGCMNLSERGLRRDELDYSQDGIDCIWLFALFNRLYALKYLRRLRIRLSLRHSGLFLAL